MKQLIFLIALVVLFPLTATGQGRTTDTIVEVPFSQLNPNARNGSVRVVINGSPTAPCTVGDSRVLAIKLGPVWNCSDLNLNLAIDGAPIDAPYITQTPHSTLTGEQALSTLTTGLLKNNTPSGVLTVAVAGTDYLAPAGSGALLTALNASQLTTGTIPDARFPATLPALSGINLTALNANNLSSGTIPDARFPASLPAISGVNLTSLNASNLAVGTIPDARFPIELPSISGANLTQLNASNLSAGTLPDGRFPATLPAVSGVNLTSLNASNITGGTVAPARLGTGSGGSTKFLREDSSWQTIPGGGDALTASPLSQFAATTSAQLAGVLSDESGSGLAVFNNSPVLVTPTIANLVNMGHDHTSAAMGGQLTDAALSSVVTASKGGTGNAFFQVSGPAASIKTFTFPNASANVLTDAAIVTIAQGGTGQTSATAAFNALDPLTTKGDLLSHDGTNSVRLAVGTNGLCVKANSATTTGLEWGTCGAGTGDVVGPASATDNAIVRFDTTTGKLVQNSGVTIDDSNNIVTTGTITSGSGGSEGGVVELGEGTAPSLVANTFSIYAPTDVAAGGLAYVVPAAAASGLMWATNAGGVHTITHDGASQAKTLTNTVMDVEGTGNALTTVGFIEFVTAGVNAGSAGPMLDVPATNGPTAAVIAGTNSLYGVLDFDAATDESIQGSLVLPDDWTGNIDFYVDWQAVATTGNAVFGLQTACVAVDETSDPAFNSAQTITDAALGTTNRRNVATITPVTMTGCTAGERLHFKFFRDADNGSDTMAGDARVKSLLFKLRRAQ